MFQGVSHQPQSQMMQGSGLQNPHKSAAMPYTGPMTAGVGLFSVTAGVAGRKCPDLSITQLVSNPLRPDRRVSF
eukprot:1029375-Rhodomonas_salina.3